MRALRCQEGTSPTPSTSVNETNKVPQGAVSMACSGLNSSICFRFGRQYDAARFPRTRWQLFGYVVRGAGCSHALTEAAHVTCVKAVNIFCASSHPFRRAGLGSFLIPGFWGCEGQERASEAWGFSAGSRTQ
jgi:hypothetical protein